MYQIATPSLLFICNKLYEEQVTLDPTPSKCPVMSIHLCILIVIHIFHYTGFLEYKLVHLKKKKLPMPFQRPCFNIDQVHLGKLNCILYLIFWETIQNQYLSQNYYNTRSEVTNLRNTLKTGELSWERSLKTILLVRQKATFQ